MSEVRLITPITRQGANKMQVAAYCRVSSNSADQLNSYAAQIRAYKKYIGAHENWELVDIFADEGLTGMKSDNRDEFQRMIRMCELKQIDLIVTKSISRFARNTKDALAHVRKLKLLGVGVQFEKEGISTLSMGDEMLLNTFSALAQEESQAISMNQRLSIVKRMELGEYVDSNAPYGYRLVNKELVVYEPEAAIVRNIFTLYLHGFSTTEIARELSKLKIPTKTGKENWRPTRVAYILKNERYIGDSFYQKTYRETTVPFNQHINRGQEDRFYATGTHPGIIEKDVFESVQSLIKKRRDALSRTTTQNTYPLTSRIQCSECGSYYRRRFVSGMEDKLQAAIVRAVNKFNEQDNATYKALMRATISEALGLNGDPEEVDMLERKVEALNKKMLELVNESILAGKDVEAHENEFMTLSQEAELLKQRIAAIQDSANNDAGEQSRLEQIQAIIAERESKCMEYDDAIVRQMVECIKVYPGGKLEIIFGGGYLVEESV